MSKIDLKLFREEAGMNQTQVAEYLGLSQSQIARYEEKEYSDIPMGLLFKWLEFIGRNPIKVFAELNTGDSSGIEIDNPFEDLIKSLDILKQYMKIKFHERNDDDDLILNNFINYIDGIQIKPNLVLTGPFDSGKSKLANTLIGKSILPEGYTPTTKLIHIVKHLSDKPSWMKENVWLLNKSFNPLDWKKEPECFSAKLIAGDYELLDKYTEYLLVNGNVPFYALVYIDSPILLGCNIIDPPGDDSSKFDDEKIEVLYGMADILIYVSPANGFMRNPEFPRLARLIENMPDFSIYKKDASPLENLFIVAGQANNITISDKDLQIIFNSGAERLYNFLSDNVLMKKFEFSHLDNNPSLLKERFFAFWKEDKSRKEILENNLINVITELYPDVKTKQISSVINKYKTEVKKLAEKSIQEYQNINESVANAKKEYESIIKEEESRKLEHKNQISGIENKIEKIKSMSADEISSLYIKFVTEENIKKLIDEKFDGNKSSGKELVPNYIMERLNMGFDSILTSHTSKFNNDINNIFDVMETNSKERGHINFTLAYDRKAAFIGGLSGLTAYGGLAVWASTAGNLGGYILAAKGVSILSSLGIGLGGTAAVNAFIATIGGPFTIAASLALVAGLSTYKLFSASWKDRLAKGIVDAFEKNEIKNKFISLSDKYWNDTLFAFSKGMNNAEEKWQLYLNELKEIVRNPENSKRLIESKKLKIEGLRDFFTGLPWKY